ncbi:MAG: zf-TFIIB domain-containing protein [Deltaproteobacteria bacterium]|jgi:Zn-finger nucleic acid-binding protein
MTIPNYPEPLFDNIALSLSGGGVRAVGFHLGTMAYLDRIGFLKKVKILSTVSGGTVVGMGYAVYLMEGKSFGDFYHDVIDDIDRSRDEPSVLESILKHLNKWRPPSPSGRRNLVTALAQGYDEGFQFCQGRRFDLFWADKKPDFHLEDIIFNATEFKRGIGFRFHYCAHNEQCDSGSDRVVLVEELARKARLADILAASTCIPVGLEPLEFPNDFRWPDDGDKVPKESSRLVCKQIREHFEETFKERSVALMDGGVYDNQGIASVLRALELKKKQPRASTVVSEEPEARTDLSLLGLMRAGTREPSWLELVSQQQEPISKPTPPKSFAGDALFLGTCPKCQTPRLESTEYFGVEVERCPECHGVWFDEKEVDELIGQESDLDLFIVSDTPLREDPLYQIKEWRKRGKVTLRMVTWIAIIIFGMALLSAAGFMIFYPMFHPFKNFWEKILKFILIGFPPIMILLFLFFALTTGLWFWSCLRSIPGLHGSAWKFIKKLKVTDAINMIYLRFWSTWAMTTDIFMNRIRFLGYALLFAQKRLKRKIIANEIDSLLRTEHIGHLPEWLKPTQEMTEDVVPTAAKIPTKLWFDPPGDKKHRDYEFLISCGQATICYNLLAHMWFNCPKKDAKEEKFKDQDVQNLFDELKKDWLSLTDDAFVFVDERKTASDILAPIE